ncbi:F-box/kelch-repeat protein [Cardamine amara subsp. amara]|uniref:F-box/kelch-repeat protein n=1 Tax=Cardamine amara subsp. amara TaxID=228776 RepID=A0ABD1AXW1_CARAN
MRWMRLKEISIASCKDVPFRSQKYLVPSGNEELFLVEGTIPDADVIDFGRLTCRVSRLDEEAREWVVVSDLGDRVLFIGEHGNVSCSGKELPDGCGVSGNSMLFTDWPGHEIYFCKYGVETEYAEDDLNFWRLSREYGASVLNKSPPVVALRIED